MLRKHAKNFEEGNYDVLCVTVVGFAEQIVILEADHF
jgi:hypothetical protein